MNSPQSLPIAVVGAGIGGLAAAIALRAEGFRVRLYEQTATKRERGAAIGLRASTVQVLRGWGLTDAYEPNVFRFDTIQLLRGDTGHPHGEIALSDVGGEPGQHWHDSIRRGDLHRLLSSLVPADSVYLSKQCDEVVDHGDHVEVRFADGGRDLALAVVGADGIHSRIRQTMAPDHAVYSGLRSFPGIVPADRVKDLVPEARALMWEREDARSFFVVMPVQQGRYLGFDAILPAAETGAESWRSTITRDELVRRLRGFVPAIPELVRRVDDTEVIAFSMYDRAPIPHWTSNRVTLLGDAAHPMLPSEGQGANLAIQDAVALAGHLRGAGPGEIPAALRRYSDVRAPIAAEIQRASREMSPFLRLQKPTPEGPS
jgi:salicylate hydroxylase